MAGPAAAHPPPLDLAGLKELARQVEVEGVGLSLVEAGRGPALVMVHGVGSSSYTWRHSLPHLAQDRRVLAVDLPGCGYSQKPADFAYTIESCAGLLAGLCDRLGLGRAAFMGHSLGGAVCQSLALARPELASALVLVGSTSLFGPRVEHPPRLAENLALFTYQDKSLITRELLKMCQETGSSPEAKAAAAALLADSARTRRPPQGLALPPGLVVWGAEDRIFPQSQAWEVARLFAEARVEIMPGCGHAPHEERPAEFITLARKFLSGR